MLIIISLSAFLNKNHWKKDWRYKAYSGCAEVYPIEKQVIHTGVDASLDNMNAKIGQAFSIRFI